VTKRIQATEQHSVCDVCGRTMLKGEVAEPYLLPSRERRFVCELCAPRAQQEGWIRESANPSTPAHPPRPPSRRRLFGRRRGGRPEPDVVAASEDGDAPPPVAGSDGSEPWVPPRGEAPASAEPSTPRDPRHVRAVPTNAQLKIERALDVFNGSEHPATVAGIARTLGPPQVSAVTSEATSAEVVLTVAWELSWYQYVVDLSDTNEPVRMHARGEEIEELAAKHTEWNAEARPDGTLAAGQAEIPDGEEEGEAV
jgi:hypothetical protein